MLLNIIDPAHFSECLKNVKKSLWPYDENYRDCFAFPSGVGDSAEAAIQARDGMEAAIQRYLKTDNGYCIENGGVYEMPFCAELHRFYAGRKWPQLPSEDPAGYLLTTENSANLGNYNHMVNVVAAGAHLIHYCSQMRFDNIADSINAYAPKGDKRTLRLMTAAYYHDIGKVIVNRRHAVEGMSLFAEQKASMRNQFEQFYGGHDFKWTSCDCAYISALIGSHDVFGTISTGENGYFSLASVVQEFALLENGDIQAVKNDMFDLWLLNIADIIVSLENKWVPHKHFTENLPGERNEIIEGFLRSVQGRDLLNDLNAAISIAEYACQAYDLDEYVSAISEKAAPARFIRLLQQTLWGAVADGKEKSLESRHPGLGREMKDLVFDTQTIHMMVATVMGEKLGTGWARLFGNMGQFDYALGFFRKAANRAVRWISHELAEENGVRTGWLYSQKPGGRARNYSEDFLSRYNAEAITHNYIVFMSDIFCDIAKLTEGMGHWHIEFEDALSRLTDQKADKLLYIDGPHRAGHMRSLLMKELMLYRS